MAKRTSKSSGDRTGSLAFFGALFLLFGIAAGFAGMMTYFLHPDRYDEAGWKTSSALLWIFGVGALFYLILGYGVSRRRCWGRRLALGAGAIALLKGIAAYTLIVMHQDLYREAFLAMVPGASDAAADTSLTLGGALLLLGVPGILVGYFTSPAVRRTCEHANPKAAPDRGSIGSSIGGTALLVSAMVVPAFAMLGGFLPWFGDFASRIWPGTQAGEILAYALGGLAFIAALGALALKPWGWWLGIPVLGTLLGSFGYTFWNHGAAGIFEIAPLPAWVAHPEPVAPIEAVKIAAVATMGAGFLLFLFSKGRFRRSEVKAGEIKAEPTAKRDVPALIEKKPDAPKPSVAPAPAEPKPAASAPKLIPAAPAPALTVARG
ncbi:MAG: hypothetical protein R3F11_29200 [Verrucomicrobiales bacterium]